MKLKISLFVILLSLFTYSQNIAVDSETYTPQQLIEDILIDSDCITNITVTNAIGGDFNGTDQSYGFFDATGTSFPFQSGIVLSTGRLSNVPGPNNNLSDDDAPNWSGDTDLEIALNETNTFNATLLEFDFTAIASQISFRYIFASEEYQENNPNSCDFSDLFGFLIRPTDGQNQYENIALVPNTDIPVKATTVTPGVSGSCPPQNDTYFGSYNGVNSPINFNGQTAILTATANVIPNEQYHVKLVIADEQNFRFDSAVFLEAGSFQLSTDLGPNRLIATGNALCEGETLEIDINQPGQNSYDWYKDGALVQSTPSSCFNCGIYEVIEPGTYTVEVGLGSSCVAYGEVVIEYAPLPEGNDSVLIECDFNQDGLTTYNLFNALDDLKGADTSVEVQNFYSTEDDAINDDDPIENPTSFENEIPAQTLYARLVNPANCFDIVELVLQTSNNIINIQDLNACDDEEIDGFTSFNLDLITASIQNQIPANSDVNYYETATDAENESNPLPIKYRNEQADSQTLYVKVQTNSECFSISTVNINVLKTPLLEDDQTVFYCTDTFPELITIETGISNDSPSNYEYQWFYNGALTNITTSSNEINSTGIYDVMATHSSGCSSNRTITVLPSNNALIENVNVEGLYPENSITITVSGDGDYEFALGNEDGPYQQSNSFISISEGFRTLYVRDKNGCGTVSETISVLGFPKFFTPNGDSKNDTWQISGSNAQFNLIESVKIFNRYGKLIQEQIGFTDGWDGDLNGNRLRNDDYWFIAKFLDGRTYTGHFALRR